MDAPRVSPVGQALLKRHARNAPQKQPSTELLCLHDVARSVLESSAFRPERISVDAGLLKESKAGLWEYQAECVDACVSESTLQSGVVIVPCGGGKTHIGAALATLARSAIVLTPSVDSMRQWRAALVARFAPERVFAVAGACDMPRGRVLAEGEYVIVMTHRRFLRNDIVRAFGSDLLIIDEVHRGVSFELRTSIGQVPRHNTIGLSATIVREDDELSHMPGLCGNEIVRMPLSRLVQAGALTPVDCFTVHVAEEPFPPSQVKGVLERIRLGSTSPNKLAYLYQFLSSMGPDDRTIVFVDDLWSLAYVQRAMRACGIASIGPLTGNTSAKRRQGMLCAFAEQGRVLFVGRVLDESWDARANAMVQMCTPWGSRRQFHQRIGRVQRIGAWSRSKALTLCCSWERRYVTHRDAYIRDEGYAVHSVTDEAQVCNLDLSASRLVIARSTAPSPDAHFREVAKAIRSEF